MPLSPTVITALEDIFPRDALLVSPGDMEPFARDASELSSLPGGVVFPDNAAQIAALLRLANEKRFAVVPRGGGTGLAGGCLADDSGVVLSLERLNRILEIDTGNLTATVEPGVITQDLRTAAMECALFYPPDPAGMDRSTIGGNAATNAGGPACVKYGVTRDYILGVRAVLPSGEMIRAGTRTRKGVVGFDLAHLLVGSEGALGVITELTLKLLPLPRHTAGFAALFPSMRDAVTAVGAIMARGHLPSALEFMDHACLGLVQDLLPFGVPFGASMLLIEADGDEAQSVRTAQSMEACCRDTGATEILKAADDAERDSLWAIRRSISLRIHDSAPRYLSEDVVVPLDRIPDLVDALPTLAREHGLTIYAFGHAGDGNIHVNITGPDDPDMDQRMDLAVRACLGEVLRLGGTISGEHGIGLAKLPYVSMELSEESMRVQRAIKQAFDPNNILNPGKVLPAP